MYKCLQEKEHKSFTELQVDLENRVKQSVESGKKLLKRKNK